MPSIRISKEFASGIYYLTFTIKNWYYLFDRHNRFEILADSIQYKFGVQVANLNPQEDF